MPPDPETLASSSGAGHVPVLLEETLEALAPAPGETYVDCTAGLGGHAGAVAARLASSGLVVLNDADESNLVRAREVVAQQGGVRVTSWVGNFASVPRRCEEEGVSADVLLADLGFASTHVAEGERGFSFQREGPLDMRYDRRGGSTAADLVNSLDEHELADLLREFGEERESRRIAQKIVVERAQTPITTTARLASIVRSALGPSRAGAKDSRIDPATRTFQALRIAVNDELGSLSSLLDSVRRAASLLLADPGRRTWLRPGARIGVISFHSLEDRQVKQAFDGMIDIGVASPIVPGAGGSGRRSRPFECSEVEASRNPRARSARLRAIRLKPM